MKVLDVLKKAEALRNADIEEVGSKKVSKSMFIYYINIYESNTADALFSKKATTKKEAFKILKELKCNVNRLIHCSSSQKIKDIKINSRIECEIDRYPVDDDFDWQNIYSRCYIIKNYNYKLR